MTFDTRTFDVRETVANMMDGLNPTAEIPGPAMMLRIPVSTVELCSETVDGSFDASVVVSTREGINGSTVDHPWGCWVTVSDGPPETTCEDPNVFALLEIEELEMRFPWALTVLELKVLADEAENIDIWMISETLGLESAEDETKLLEDWLENVTRLDTLCTGVSTSVGLVNARESAEDNSSEVERGMANTVVLSIAKLIATSEVEVKIVVSAGSSPEYSVFDTVCLELFVNLYRLNMLKGNIDCGDKFSDTLSGR
jgi:hypothetical protein